MEAWKRVTVAPESEGSAVPRTPHSVFKALGERYVKKLSFLALAAIASIAPQSCNFTADCSYTLGPCLSGSGSKSMSFNQSNNDTVLQMGDVKFYLYEIINSNSATIMITAASTHSCVAHINGNDEVDDKARPYQEYVLGKFTIQNGETKDIPLEDRLYRVTASSINAVWNGSILYSASVSLRVDATCPGNGADGGDAADSSAKE